MPMHAFCCSYIPALQVTQLPTSHRLACGLKSVPVCHSLKSVLQRYHAVRNYLPLPPALRRVSV
jgi:hypothetical protein